METTMYYLGCPMWANQRWRGSLFHDNSQATTFLSQYGRFFNAVEGNTTFYAAPSAEMVQRWDEQSPESFRFTFKVPKTISHQMASVQELRTWLTLIKPLRHKIGFIHLQLPASFGPEQLPHLTLLLETIRADYPCALEVRHPAFFDKAQQQQALHQLLRATMTERLCLDSRALFSVPADSAALIDAQQKKPRLPVHAVALTSTPVFRFIGLDDLAANRPFYQPWLAKMQNWCAQGFTPYAFFHTPDNNLAPQLARQFAADFAALSGESHPVLQPWPESTPQQDKPQLTLF
jgi:uncharacterized protein YecE (DUF72 family)